MRLGMLQLRAWRLRSDALVVVAALSLERRILKKPVVEKRQVFLSSFFTVLLGVDINLL